MSEETLPDLPSPKKRRKRPYNRHNDTFNNFFRASFFITTIVLGTIEFFEKIQRNNPNWKKDFRVNIDHFINLPFSPFLGMCVLGLFGYILYAFKKYQQYWYGIVESGVALLGCYFVVLYYQRHEADLIKLFSALYLCVRGYENASKGSEKEYWFKSWLDKRFNRQRINQ